MTTNTEYATISDTGEIYLWCLKFLAREKAKMMDNFLCFAVVKKRRGHYTVSLKRKI